MLMAGARMKKSTCPHCSGPVNTVNAMTMSHHLLYPHCLDIPNEEVFAYCCNPCCELAYFSDNTHYKKEHMQSRQQVLNKTLCFCFGITEATFLAELAAGDEDAFFSNVDQLAQTRKCVCKQKNPSGKGCLSVFRSRHSATNEHI